MQVRLADPEAACFIEQSARNQCTDAPATQSGNYRYAADLTRRIKSPSANWFTVQADKNVNTDGIVVIPLVGFGDFLLLDEDFAPNALQCGTIRVPGGEHTF